MALGTARGLQHIHSLKIVHLDLKASNIMLQDGKIKICDFGLASVLPAAAEMKGTWHWMAPETITNRWRSEDFTTGCDVWSFGVLMLGMTSL